MLLVATAETALSTREAWRLQAGLVWSHRDVRPMMRHCSSWVSTSLSTLTGCLQSWSRTWETGRRGGWEEEAWGYLSVREMGQHWPSLVAPGRILQQHRSPFWPEGTPAGKGISPELQEAPGLYRTVYPTNINVYSFTFDEKKFIFTQIYLIQQSIPCIHRGI